MKEIKNRLGKIVNILLIAMPAVFWLSMASLSQRFFSASQIFTSLGQLAGLTGIALISLSFILAARLKFLGDYFGGMDKIYQSY
ncbi:MAG: hypothetical protein A2174_03235 [Candidatus Portnoybacteria bacterium RBG_13_41_18]|uniref:Uncharacterized protein n=1 Tax=Candidatus Portnoybacteria bacterium RBG_13_41_18 TaxID=1801991 RepID=A0A1G2F798_9BACT|nr:MAG: hypothetical protein A2174_03235 [Candidatus Portnoybacteria bacterium RBG_13_41_18]